METGTQTGAATKAAADRAGLERIGRIVRARLAEDRRIYWIERERAEIIALGEFMSEAECARMRDKIDACARPSTVFDLDYSSGYRTSYSGDVDPRDPFVKKISRRIDDLLGIEAECGETIQGQRYMPGQEFQPHHDWFHPDTSYWEHEMGRGGQRSYTAMVFLNDVPQGGTTDFTELDMCITPKAGVLLAWNNADRAGVPNPATIHAGRPVAEGVKYIITKWYRTRKWT